MRKLIVLLALAGVIVGGGYLALFKTKEVKNLADSGSVLAKTSFEQARGYGPAKSPTEAIDFFKKAIKAHDFETAATYCGPEYAEQLRKAAPAAKPLAEEIDNLNYKMEERKIVSEQAKLILALLEPFPTNIEMVVGKGPSATKAVAKIAEQSKGLKDLGQQQQWKIDLLLVRPLQRGLPGEVEMRKEGEFWKIYFPATADLQLSVSRLKEKGQDYTNAINRVKLDLQSKTILTKDELETNMRSELEKANH